MDNAKWINLPEQPSRAVNLRKVVTAHDANRPFLSLSLSLSLLLLRLYFIIIILLPPLVFNFISLLFEVVLKFK